MKKAEHKPIYIQIVNIFSEKILKGDWQEGFKMPSVRELGIELGVNHNTVIRAYDFLTSYEVVYSKKGIGYFVAEKAIENIREFQKIQTKIKTQQY